MIAIRPLTPYYFHESQTLGIMKYPTDKTVYIKEEECGCFERLDRKFSNIKRLVRNKQVKDLESQWNS